MPPVASRRLAATALISVALLGTGCAGTTGGEEGPVQVSSATPTSGTAPGLGSATVGGVTVSGVTLRKSGPGIGVLAAVTSTAPDRLVSIASNYTQTDVLTPPIAVTPGSPTTLDPTTAVLQKSGPIDDGATVAVTFTFASAGPVQVFASYRT